MRTIGKILILIAAWFAIYFYGAWWSMLMLGVAHSTNDAVPAFGYWTMFFLLASLSGIASAPLAYMRISDGLYGLYDR